MKIKTAEEEKLRNTRYFDSTNKTTYEPKHLTENVVGRKVMKTQDGKLVPLPHRDELLMVEHGY